MNTETTLIQVLPSKSELGGLRLQSFGKLARPWRFARWQHTTSEVRQLVVLVPLLEISVALLQNSGVRRLQDFERLPFSKT